MKSDKITELYFSDVDQPISVDRREFLKKLGGGIIVVFCLGKLSLLDGWGQNAQEALNFNAYLRIKEDGRVDCFTGKVEMGQGIITSLPQVVAEELEVDIEMIDMVMGDTDLVPYDAGTWGSLTTRFADPVIRAAAAEAREILIDLAAKKLDVDITELKVENGTIFNRNNKNQQISYAALTKGKKIVSTVQKKPKLKHPDDYKIIGKSYKSMDASAKVTGKALYSGDIMLPDMVHAVVVRPLDLNARKIAVTSSDLSDFKGAELIEDGDLVAVIHSNPETAARAAKKVKVKWETPDAAANDTTIFDYFKKNIDSSRTFEEGGDLEAGRSASANLFKESYKDGYKAHAPIETHSATCYFKDDRLIVWSSTQTPFGTRQELANTFDMPVEKVHVKQIFLGGGFGGKVYNQQAVEAAKIAKICGKPVQLVWTRREEFLYDKFRPAALVNITSGVDESGHLNLWEFDIYCAGTRGTKLFYGAENNRTRIFNKRGIHPLLTGAWRAPGNNTTTFARESHIDSVAHGISMDPLEFRLKNVKDERMLATLKLGAKAFNWHRKKDKNIGFGIALGQDAGTMVAIFAEVFVDPKTKEVKPIHIVCAQDMGQVVNPHGAIVQTEGGITMGIGYALSEDIRFEGGKVKTRNFSNYEFTRFSTTPKISCVFVDKMNEKPQGGGEPAIICVGGAIANAIFDACGARVYQMPMTADRIKSAL